MRRGPGQRSQYSYSLRAGRSEVRRPVGARFAAPVQTGLGSHSAIFAMGTEPFPGVKRPRRDVKHPPHLAARLKSTAILLPPFGPSWLVLGWTIPFVCLFSDSTHHTEYTYQISCPNMHSLSTVLYSFHQWESGTRFDFKEDVRENLLISLLTYAGLLHRCLLFTSYSSAFSV